MKIIRKKINEEAPINNVGGGNIAGVGIGPKGEPGVHKSGKTPMFRRKPLMTVREGQFAGNKTFIVPNNIFERARLHKRKGGHWEKYLDEDAYSYAIREYANKNPYKPIIFEDEKTGCMVYARYGGENDRKRRMSELTESDDIGRLLQHDAEIQKMSKTKPEFPSLHDTLGKQQGQYDALPAGQVAKGIDPDAGKTPNYDPQGNPSPETPGFYSGRVMTGPTAMPKPPARPLREEFSGEMLDEETLLEKSVNDFSPAELKQHRKSMADGAKWHKKNPVHKKNIINAYNDSTSGEREHGENWYKDAHHTVKALAKDTGVSHHTMAGLVSVYSPQTPWHTNILTAAKVARSKKAVGGPGSGVMASSDQRERAHRMLKGEHNNSVLAGQKTQHFAHLIEHGGNEHPPEHPEHKDHVVIDRHAHSVASGARITDAAFGQAGLKSKKGYGKVHKAYVDAAKHLSEQHGRTIHAHQVQAVTWLRQQRVNSEGTKAGASKVAHAARERWHQYAGEHHPHLVGKEPGTGYAQQQMSEALLTNLIGKVRTALAKRKESKQQDKKVADSAAKFKASREAKQAKNAAHLNRSFDVYHKLVKSRSSLEGKHARNLAQKSIERVQQKAGQEQRIERKTIRRDSISAKAATTRDRNKWRREHGKPPLRRSEVKKWREKIKPKPLP